VRHIGSQVCLLCTTGNQQRVTCDVCAAESYFGARWKCCECHDYDLCDECYHGDRHDVTHQFKRFDLATSEGFVAQASGLLIYINTDQNR